jgi:hypothetical protein
VKLRPTSAAAIILSLAILAPTVAAAGQVATDYGQLVVRFNPKRDPGKPAYTVADCFAIDDCLTTLTQKLLQAGGNAGLIKGAREERPPDVSGEESIYRFTAAEGESFCTAFLLKLSAAPSSGAFTPGLKFSASRKAVVATVRLPASEGAPPRAWFDGILILLSVRDAAFAGSSCSLGHAAREMACRGNCQNTGF